MQVVPTAVRQALRRLAATPLLSIAAVVTLAPGIASTVVMADVLDRLLLRAPAHVREPERVKRLYLSWGRGEHFDRIGYGAFEAVRPLHGEIEDSAVFFSETLSLGRGRSARSIEITSHTPAYFDVLGGRPLLGSWTTASLAGRADAAVISYGLWQQAYVGKLRLRALSSPTCRHSPSTTSSTACCDRGDSDRRCSSSLARCRLPSRPSGWP